MKRNSQEVSVTKDNKICLLMCMTTCNHNFQNLYSYNDIVSECVIYDTGLKSEEKTLINKTLKCPVKFEKGYFNNDFGLMRNRALSVIPKDADFVIFPDDSWSINGFSKDLLDDRNDYYITKIFNNGFFYDTIKIFKNLQSSVKFTETNRNEELIIDKYRTKTIKSYFVDTYPDVTRTRKINEKVLVTDFKDLFHAGSYYQLEGNMKLARKCYLDRLQEVDCDSEEKFLMYCYLALMDKNEKYYMKATEVYPDRAPEAFYYMYLVTGNKQYLIQAKLKISELMKLYGYPHGPSRLMINPKIYKEILTRKL